jgi:hypothetical protein
MPLIHQIVLGNTVPRLNRACLDSWQQLEPYGFQIVAWTDRSVREYLATHALPEAVALYGKARNYGEASDILRMAIAHDYGGFYIDWDVLLVDPEQFLTVVAGFESNHCVLIRDPLTTEPQFACSYDNSLFYVEKGDALPVDFLSDVERNYAGTPLPDTPYLTGPLALARFLQRHPVYENHCRMIDTLQIYAFDYEDVMSRSPDPLDRELLTHHWKAKANGAPAIHFWTHAWAPRPTWARRVLARLRRTVTAARIEPQR